MTRAMMYILARIIPIDIGSFGSKESVALSAAFEVTKERCISGA